MSANGQSRHNTHDGNFDARYPAEYVKALVTFDCPTPDRENIQSNVLDAKAYLLKHTLLKLFKVQVILQFCHILSSYQMASKIYIERQNISSRFARS